MSEDNKVMSNKALKLANLMTIKETYEYLNISKPTMYRWIADDTMGFPQPVRLGRRVGYKKKDIDEWLRMIGA